MNSLLFLIYQKDSYCLANGCTIMNGRVLHSIFLALVPLYQTNKIYQKMQREKLYKMHTIAFLIVALFVFKIVKTSSGQIFTVRKWWFFSQKQFISPSYSTYLSSQVVYLKWIKYINRCSVKSSTISIILISYSCTFYTRKSIKIRAITLWRRAKSVFQRHDRCILPYLSFD